MKIEYGDYAFETFGKLHIEKGSKVIVEYKRHKWELVGVLEFRMTRIQAWLNRTLTNTWMANPDFDAAMAHIGWAWLLIVLVGSFWMIPVMLLFAAVKEFWFDATYEIPKQTNRDNWEDFLTYSLGTVAGALTLLLRAV